MTEKNWKELRTYVLLNLIDRVFLALAESTLKIMKVLRLVHFAAIPALFLLI